MAKTKPKAGRPAGSPNKQVDQVEAAKSRCVKCGSTQRDGYYHRQELEQSGTDAQGKPYTHVVWRRTKCLACGQHRVDRTYENRPAPKRPKRK